MRMRILVVEDDQVFLPHLLSLLKFALGSPECVVASDRDTAIAHLRSTVFDLVLLDMRLPPDGSSIEVHEDHGVAVFKRSRELAPGTPVFVLTGSPSTEFMPDLVREAGSFDIWGGEQKLPTVSYLPKYRLQEFSEQLQGIAQAFLVLSDVELLQPIPLDLDEAETRVLRIFTRRRGASQCTMGRLSGLSDSKVLRLTLRASDGSARDHAVAKIGPRSSVEMESENYRRHVSRLPNTATPRHLETIRYGASSKAGVFYTLAHDFGSNLFEAVRANRVEAIASVACLERITGVWADGVPSRTMAIREIRRRLLPDSIAEDLIKRYGLGWAEEFESRNVMVRWCCTHGDLHGANVLMQPDGNSVIIDYGDIGLGPSCLDSLTVEFSAIYHPDGPFLGTKWPTITQGAAAFSSLEEFLAGCPNAEFVRDCRRWTNSCCVGVRDVAATAYSYLLRQLKYPKTDPELTLALLGGAKSRYDAT